jgi:hypothetical protein
LAGFGIKGVEVSGSATGSYLISNTYFTELSFQDGRWIQLAQESSIAGFGIKGVESSGSDTEVVVC